MAQRTTVEYVDDLDGSASEDVQTVEFALDGVTYEIDLNSDNAGSLREGLSRYVEAARRTGGRLHRGASAHPGGRVGQDRARSKAIREWAIANGYEVSERGRLSATLVEAYETAQTQPKTKPATDPAPRRRTNSKTAAADSTEPTKRRRSRKAEPAFSG